MSAATEQILEQLKSLTLLEAAELVKQIEEAFGVSAAAPAGHDDDAGWWWWCRGSS